MSSPSDVNPPAGSPASPKKGSRELVRDRLATTDARGNRVYLYPADYSGKYRTRRARLRGLLVVFFLFFPWIRIGGHPAILLDIASRRFSILGVQFWAHDAPMLLFVFGGAAVALLFATAVWGRVWCGWACPQTVFVEGVFRRLERMIEGDGLTRRRRDEGPWTGDKLWRKTLKWSLFLAVSLVITHSFLAYFVGTSELITMITRSPAENLTSFLVIVVTTAIILFDFGWFREQFCTIACPYGRLQSVVMDEKSMIVGYDARRGEPRSGTAAPDQPKGDCVNCFRCVQVCPTGIDIRRGVQLECIACTACVDACDEVMLRLKKPAGLIRYASEAELEGRPRKLGLRPLLYAAVLGVLMTGLALTLYGRKIVDSTFVRAIGTPYELTTSPQTGKPEVVNHFHVDLTNQSFHPMEVRFLPPAELAQQVVLVTPENPIRLEPGISRRVELFIRFPKEVLVFGKKRLSVDVQARGPENSPAPTSHGAAEYTVEVPLVGPF